MTNEPLETLLQTGLRSRPEPDLICFDVFDTLLTRTVGSPEGIFLQLGERLWAEKRTSMTPEEFARARVSAERRARSNLVKEKEISLSQIYKEIKAAYPIIGITVSELKEAELEIEKESLVAIPGAIDAVLLARQRTKKIAFVSDMYLPEIFIKEILIEGGLADNGDLFYVSSSRKVTKVGGGELFKCMLDELGINNKNVIHIGDSWLSDIKPANALGLQTIHYKSSHSNRYERELEEARWSCRGLSSRLSGASKLTRMKHSADYLDPAFLTVAAGVAAPLFTSFVIWLLEEAERKGIRRLYFLSREGEVIFDVAKQFNERFNLGFDIRYLCVSRLSLNRTVLVDLTEENLMWTLTHTERESIRSILLRLGFSFDEVSGSLSGAGFEEKNVDQTLTHLEYKRLMKVLSEDAVKEKIRSKAIAAGNVAEKYFSQERYFEDIKIGLVDTSGSGSQLRTLAKWRTSKGLSMPEGFLMLRDRPTIPVDELFPLIHTYLSDLYNRVGYGRLTGMIQMLEVFSATDYGTVLAYKHDKHSVQPVFDKLEMVSSSGLDDPRKLREIILTFASVLDLKKGVFHSLEVDCRPAVVSAFKLFWESPSSDEARVWGPSRFNCGAGRNSFVELAPRLGAWEYVLRALGRSPKRTGWYTWWEGSRLRASRRTQLLIKVSRRIRGFGVSRKDGVFRK